MIGIPKDGSKKQFYKKFKHVVDSADIVLEVLDARYIFFPSYNCFFFFFSFFFFFFTISDPLGCRCKEAETMVASGNKKLIFVLNKVDLVPRGIAEKWVRYLKGEFPTVAFKASTQKAKARFEIKSNQIKSNQIKSNQIKSNQIKSNQIINFK